MRPRPFSSLAYIFRYLWDGIPLLFWLGVCAYAYRKIAGVLLTPPELTAPFAIFATAIVMYALRPVRKYLMLHAYALMLRVPVRPVTELGIWKLLILHEKYWPSELPNYLGMAMFAAVYRSKSVRGARRLNDILWRVEYVGKPELAKAARSLLREVNAPLRPEWQTTGLP